jgi:hypothetical protein
VQVVQPARGRISVGASTVDESPSLYWHAVCASPEHPDVSVQEAQTKL